MNSPLPPEPEEKTWTVNGLSLAGLCWGDPADQPLLALHGWLDNAASFVRLAPLLEGRYVVALDLTGHGHSDQRSADASYQIWDDLPEIFGVLDALGWKQFDLIGHSRGAIISTLVAASSPERVSRLVLLDGLFPQAVEASAFVQQMRSALQDKPRLLSRRNRVYADAGQAIRAREARGLPLDAAEPICRRNLKACVGGFTWTTDSRLHGASPVKLSNGQIEAILRALTMPVLLLLSSRDHDLGHEAFLQPALQWVTDIEVDKMDGGHHFHMEQCAPAVAGRILQFLRHQR
ncbi:MAG: alpha/beta hydrolase [Halioglobus sp.]